MVVLHLQRAEQQRIFLHKDPQAQELPRSSRSTGHRLVCNSWRRQKRPPLDLPLACSYVGRGGRRALGQALLRRGRAHLPVFSALPHSTGSQRHAPQQITDTLNAPHREHTHTPTKVHESIAALDGCISAGNARLCWQRTPLFVASRRRVSPLGPTPLGRCFRHCRGIIEPLIQDGTFELMVTANILRNTFEQPKRELFQTQALGPNGSNRNNSLLHVVSGGTRSTHRVAEQRDVFGTGKIAFVLGSARGTHMCEQLSHSVYSAGTCDERFINDGQVIARPALVDWPLAFGATRGTLLAFCPHLSVHS